MKTAVLEVVWRTWYNPWKSQMMNIPGRLAVCVKLTVTQLVKPHRPTCFLGQLNKVNNSCLFINNKINFKDFWRSSTSLWRN